MKPAAIATLVILVAAAPIACGGEAEAEEAAAEFSKLAAVADRGACEFVEPERIEESGGCEEFLATISEGPGAESCLQQLDVTRSAAISDGSTVVAFSCGPTSPSDGESGAFGEYELIERDGNWLVRDGYIRGR